MKFKILILTMLAMFLGAFIDSGINAVNKSYEKKLTDEVYGNKLSQEQFKNNPYKALEMALKNMKPDELQIYSEKIKFFIWCTFVMKIFLWFLFSYLLSTAITKITHNKALKAQPAAAGTAPAGAATQHGAGGSAP